MVTKDLVHLLDFCHKVLPGSNRLKINREWPKHSLVGRGLSRSLHKIGGAGRGNRGALWKESLGMGFRGRQISLAPVGFVPQF